MEGERKDIEVPRDLDIRLARLAHNYLHKYISATSEKKIMYFSELLELMKQLVENALDYYLVDAQKIGATKDQAIAVFSYVFTKHIERKFMKILEHIADQVSDEFKAGFNQ